MLARSASRRRRALLAGAAVAWTIPAAAEACDAVIVPTSSVIRLDYDPFAFTRNAGRLSFEVENRGSEACSAELVLLDAARVGVAETDLGDSGVRVAFAGGGAPLTPTAAPGVWRVTLEPGRRTKVSIDAVITREAVAGAGEHTAELLLELRDLGGGPARSAPLPVRVVLAALPRAQMNIVGAAGTFGEGSAVTRVDFGQMATGATRRVFLQVRANTRGRLTIDSANRGRLLLSDAPTGEEGVSYGARLLEQAVDLTRRWEQVVEPPRSLAGASLPLDLTLGPVEGHAAGTYSDVLTLELSAI